MNVLDLQVNQMVWYDSKYIKINHIDNNSISVVISFDILEYSLFPVKIGWDFAYFPNTQLNLDLFE